MSLIYKNNYFRLTEVNLCWNKPLFQWWSELELNQRHKPFQGSALPTELPDHWARFFTKQIINQLKY